MRKMASRTRAERPYHGFLGDLGPFFMLLLQILECLTGFFLVAVTLYDVFQSVVVPRWTGRALRFAPYFVDMFWPYYRRLAQRRDPEKGEEMLGVFASLTLMLILVAWVMALVLGYGLWFHALSHQTTAPGMSLYAALYEAGVSMLTIGYGDIVPTGAVMRVVSLLAGASGLAVLALVISLTFSLYSLFQRREVFVLLMDARAGSPPSGLALLETYADYGMLDELHAFFTNGEKWSAEMLESHLSYPILPYFRSSHDGASWVSTMGALLDAATLILTTTDEVTPRTRGAAALFYRLGCHATIDLSHWFRFRLPRAAHPGEPTPQWAAGVTRGEWEAARRRLHRAGFALREGQIGGEGGADAAEAAWEAFLETRAVYAPALNALARHFASPPSTWIGDRSDLSSVFHRAPEEETV